MRLHGLAEQWPQFALTLDVGGVRLQAPTDEQVRVLSAAAAVPGAVLPVPHEHFVTWLQGRTPEQIVGQRVARVQANRDLARRPGWTLDLAVLINGEPVGLQSVSGLDAWPRRRIVGTTSWLLAAFQRRGIGIRSRAAVLELAFAHLRAESAKTWVLQDNRASIAVSTVLGYHRVDQHEITEDGHRYTEEVYQLDRDAWLKSAARRAYPVSINGAGAVIDLLDR